MKLKRNIFFINLCAAGILNDLKLSVELVNRKSYLGYWLKTKISHVLKELHPLFVWSHLIECDRQIRTVNRCKKCTHFYVYSNSAISLIKDTTTLSYLQMVGNDICTIFSDVKKKFVNLNVYYKASDFIDHGLERVNFGSPFKDLLDKVFACFVEYNQIFVRIFFNQMKFSSDFKLLIIFAMFMM